MAQIKSTDLAQITAQAVFAAGKRANITLSPNQIMHHLASAEILGKLSREIIAAVREFSGQDVQIIK